MKKIDFLGIYNTTQVCCPGRVDDPCMLSKADGEGTSQVRRWHFDVQTKQCLPFMFRGLKGNSVSNQLDDLFKSIPE